MATSCSNPPPWEPAPHRSINPLNEGDADLPNPDVDLDVSDYPAEARLRDKLSEDHTEAEFEKALEALLERLDLALSQ